MTLWVSSKHNMGMAFTRKLWEEVRSCRAYFCNFDDYNWDWSLYHVSLMCLERKIKVMLVKAPRVFHIGECGVHHHNKKDCEATATVKRVLDILSRASKFLFPDKLVVKDIPIRRKLKAPPGNGGWGDIRDKTLCLSMASTLHGEDDVEAALLLARKRIDQVKEAERQGKLPL